MVFKKEVYPFTTELISGYFPKLELAGKSVLTVGSSLDQAFNALVLGATNVTVYDINPDVKEFYDIKKNLILSTPREELYETVLNVNGISFNENEVYEKRMVSKMNCYLDSDSSYEILRMKLAKDNTSFLTGSIFDMNFSLSDKKYDRIIFSNVLQYLSVFHQEDDLDSFIVNSFMEWEEHLNKDGILQLLYLYSYDKYCVEKNAKRVIDCLCTVRELNIEEFYDNDYDRCDAIVTYQKRR